MSKLHSHQIHVETDEENVTVTIGSDGGVPGGFAKLFNRVLDSGAWARLSDAAKAAYLPLVRFSDQRNHFRVRVGQAAIMKYAGLSRSSAKRAMKDLLASKLVVLVQQGGVTETGENESNLYQLMVPAEGRAAAAPRPVTGMAAGTTTTTAPAPGAAAGARLAPGGGPLADRVGGRMGAPAGSRSEPPVGSGVTPAEVRHRTPDPVRPAPTGGATGGPQFRSFSDSNSNTSPPAAPAGGASAPEGAAALLEENGVDPVASRELARAYPYERIVDVVATMQYRQSRGRCDNPGGFIRDALVRQWPTPKAVTQARARAEARLRQEAAEQAARATQAQEATRAQDTERRVEELVAALDDEELEILAESVLKKYEGNAAVLLVLTRKPPRQCRLMKMEVAAMLEGRRPG